MNEQTKLARDVQRETVRDLYEGFHKMPVHEQARKIAHALFATGHNNYLPQEEMISNFALLSGTATAVLLDCAKRLEAQEGGKVSDAG
jgi:hypothetical protein